MNNRSRKIVCSKCKITYVYADSLVFKHGPLFTYMKCPFCGKITAEKNEQSTSFNSSFNQEQEMSEKDPSLITKEPGTSNKNYSKVGAVSSPGVADHSNNSHMSPTNQNTKAGVPSLTQAARQRLYELGYSSMDVNAIAHEAADEIIKFHITKPAGVSNSQPQPKADVPGWLVVHDETTRPQMFELKMGTNTVGRKSAMPVDISIETADITMSRRHCAIEVMLDQRRGEYDFLISDLNAVNGTIVNGQVRRRLNERDIVYLNDGDVFQLGMTKVVLKKNTELKRKEKVVQEVLNQPYAPTVVLNIEKIEYIYK